jgi:phytoene synthase
MLPMDVAKNKKGFLAAKAVTKNFAKTFYFSSKFLPQDKQFAAYSIYAICRKSDDSVDNQGSSLNSAQIDRIKNQIESVYNKDELNDDILIAFQNTVETYAIPKQYFDELIEGMYMDLQKNRYGNFEELYSYCYKVAGVVGLIMLKIFGYEDKKVEQHAIDLGIAMQLTNILRDIKEDLDKGRIYLPKNEMERFRVTESQIAGQGTGRNFIELLKFQIERARTYYAQSMKGIKMIESPNSRFVICTMKEIYSGILSVIERNSYDVFSKRAHVNTMGKLMAISKIMIKGQFL